MNATDKAWIDGYFSGYESGMKEVNKTDVITRLLVQLDSLRANVVNVEGRIQTLRTVKDFDIFSTYFKTEKDNI